jgi:hypothetical protein
MSLTHELDAAQQRYLAHLPASMLRYLTLLGFDDDDIARGMFNALSSSYWPELTFSPRWVELRVWRIPTSKAPDGSARPHPSMLPNGYAHSGPPDYAHREDYVADAYGGTRLAAHAAVWFLSLAPGVGET